MKKTNLRKALAGLITAALLTGTASALSFPDVDNNSAYAPAVAYVSEAGVMVGDSQGNFNPDKIVSRAEMAAIICRVLGQADNLSVSEAFTDVPTTHWANPYIGKAAELGAVSGYGGGRFGPSDPVTYEQAVTMIISAIGEGDKAASYGGYPNGFLQAAQEDGLLTGIQSVQGQGLSRGSVAVLLYNYYTIQNNSGTSSDGHIHNWATRHIDAIGYYQKGETHEVMINKCAGCGYQVNSDQPNANEIWERHLIDCGSAYSYWTEQVPNGEPKWIEVYPAYDETYCTICGAVK